MRIALLAPLVAPIRDPHLGGAQAFLADLATGLGSRGHEVHVYAASGSDIPGVTVVDTGIDASALRDTLYRAGPQGGSCPWRGNGVREGSDSWAAAAFASVYAAVREGRYDLVHNHAFDAPAIALARRLAVPVVHTLHLPPDHLVAAALQEAHIAGRPPCVAAVSAAQAGAWRALTRIDTVLPDGVPVSRIPWSESPGSGAVFAGRLSPEKGAAEAIAIARAAGWRIDLYGDPYDPRYADAHVYPRRGEPGVGVHPAVPRTALWDIMTRAAVVLCPVQWEEPFGLVAAEAQAAGTPVVAFQRGGLPEVIADGVTGILVRPGDTLAAARAVQQATGLKRSACRRHAEARLSLEASLDAHERLYRQMTRSLEVRFRA